MEKRIIEYNKSRALSVIHSVLDKQTDKGVNKYGHTLEECPVDKFDWQSMLIEELIDAIQYQEKEMDRLMDIDKAKFFYKDVITSLYNEIFSDKIKNYNKYPITEYELNLIVIDVLILMLAKTQEKIKQLFD